MNQTNFDFTQDVGPKDANHLKCSTCGSEVIWHKDKSYGPQSECNTSGCGGQMMSWNWFGWKNNPERQARVKEEERKQRQRRLASKEPVSQESEPLENFSEAERTIPNTSEPIILSEFGTEAPWFGPFGVCAVKIFGIRRRGDLIQFGIGNEQPPILGWVKTNAFHNE